MPLCGTQKQCLCLSSGAGVLSPVLGHSRAGVRETLIPLLALSHALEKQQVLLYVPHLDMVMRYLYLQ